MSLEFDSDETKSDLAQAETKDAKASEIVKHIRKVNRDGTYTVGFETDDGSFKIESRDVLGNVKGTYGYIDDKGEIKRVSYTTSNGTALKDIPPPVEEEFEEENETIMPSPTTHKYNRTFFPSTTRRPSSLNFLTSTTNAPHTKSSNVIQSIPKRRILLPADRSRTLDAAEPTTTIVYATSVPTPKPYLNMKPTTSKSEQSSKTEKIEIDHVSNVAIMNRDSSKSQKNEEKHTKHESRGNLLRRQLKADNEEGFEAQQQVLYSNSAGDEGSHLYGSGFGGITGVRPLYSSSTSAPKLPAQVLAARQRASQIQSLLSNSSPSTTTEKVYVKPPKRLNLLKSKIDDGTETTAEQNYLNQGPIPGQNPKEETEAADEQRRNLRERPLNPQLDQLYRPRNYLRQLQNQQQLNDQGSQGPPIPPRGFRGPPPQHPQIQQSEQYPQNDFQQPQQAPLTRNMNLLAQRFAQQYGSNQSPSQQQEPGQQAESYPAPIPFFPPMRGGNGIDYDRPLTVRDFERLLQLLVFRQNQYGRYNPYYPLPGNPTGFPPFVPSYNSPPYQQIPRPPPYYGGNNVGLFDPYYRNPNYSPSSPVPQQYDQGDGGYSSSPPSYDSSPNYDYARIPQQQQQRRRPIYDPRLIPESGQPSEQEYNYNSLQTSPSNSPSHIPSSVREQLLYRMLMLAIQSDPQLAAAATNSQTIIEPPSESPIDFKSTKAVSKKPVRSVQILGEEDEVDDIDDDVEKDTK